METVIVRNGRNLSAIYEIEVMFQSLRSQFLLPLSLTMLITGSIVAFIASVIATSSAKLAIEKRLHSVANVASNATFPLTANVLEQMRDLSSVELAMIGEDGERVVATEGIKHLRELDLRSIVSRSARSEAKQDAQASIFVHRCLIQGLRYDVALRRLKSTTSNTGLGWIAVLSPHSEQQQLRRQAVILPIITGAAATLVIGFVAASLVSRLRQRINLLRAHVGRIAKGSLEIVPISKASDEISDLTEDINRMTKQLHELQSVLSANQRATLINQIASGMAHQLRNTLTGARLAVQVFQRDNHQELNEDLNVAIDQLKLAEQSIQSLLQVRTGIDEQPTASLSVSEIINSIRSLAKNKAEHKKIKLVVDAAESLLERNIQDGQSVLGALMNLVLNAIEAAPESGCVRCDAKLAERTTSPELSDSSSRDLCRFSVIDNGAGPSESIADTMLEPFVTSKPEGIGLGLSMAKRTSERLRGDLGWRRVENRTEFIMSIPLISD